VGIWKKRKGIGVGMLWQSGIWTLCGKRKWLWNKKRLRLRFKENLEVLAQINSNRYKRYIIPIQYSVVSVKRFLEALISRPL
jgi:hypothetical protein